MNSSHLCSVDRERILQNYIRKAVDMGSLCMSFETAAQYDAIFISCIRLLYIAIPYNVYTIDRQFIGNDQHVVRL